MVSNTSEDKAADTTFLALQRPRSGSLFLPTTSTEKLGAADHALVASSMAVARWNCQLTAPPVVEPATAGTLVNLNPAPNPPRGRVVSVQVVPCSAQRLVASVGVLSPVWDLFVKRDVIQGRAVSVNPV